MSENLNKPIHPLLKTRYRNWSELEPLIESLNDDVVKGAVFEQFMFFYLKYFHDLYQIKENFCPAATGKSFPEYIRSRLKLEKYDHGVDGVWVDVDNALTAYQIKFRSNRNTPPATELASFWSEAEYADFRCVIANAPSLPRVASKKQNHIAILSDRLDLLHDDFFGALWKFANENRIETVPKANPRPYQLEMVRGVIDGFRERDRGKLIAACGIGKTLVSLWISEGMKCQVTLFLAPSLALIRQTLGQWSLNKSDSFKYLCVCSDETVDQDVNLDEIWVRRNELDIPVSTDAETVARFLGTADGKKVVFSTYQSLEVIEKATHAIEGFQFDLIISDEAHRTAGIKDSHLFSLALDDTKVKSRKRLFMTATERLVKPKIRKKIEEASRIVFSMDDENIYGPVFYRLSFGKAIQEKIISDYRIVLAGTTRRDVLKLIEQNRYVSSAMREGKTISADNLFKRLLFIKSIKDLGTKKVITFHSSIKEAQSFRDDISEYFSKEGTSTYVAHINGSLHSTERAERIKEFEKSDAGVLTNVRCLNEGVDIPIIDSVFFSDPKNSLIDIVQAVGRALRQRYGETGNLAYIVVPVLMDDGNSGANINEVQFEALFNVIQALRDQDEVFAEWIDHINLAAVKAKRTGVGRKLKFILPAFVDLDMFADNICLKIAEVNRESSGTVGLGGTLGKRQRTSTYRRIFTTLGDYNPEAYYQSLVKPTLEKFELIDQVIGGRDLKVNHNNLSHSARLGIIASPNKKEYHLTELGKRLWSKSLSFDAVFKNQMLLYSLSTEVGFLFPYRMAFKVMERVGRLNYIEFLYGLYSVQTKAADFGIEETVNTILWIRKEFPNVALTSSANQEHVREVLNQRHPIGFKGTDVWTDRTTCGNQFRFFSNHMALFDQQFVLNWEKKELSLNGNAASVSDLLKKSTPSDGDFLGRYGNWVWIES